MELDVKKNDLDELLTINEVAGYLKVGRAAVISLVHNGKLPARKIGRVYRIRKKDLAKILDGSVNQ